MAAVTVDAARAARREAKRLRVDAQELRLAVRRSLRLVNARSERATALLLARRVIPVASPWSGLVWFRADEDLDRVLTPVD